VEAALTPALKQVPSPNYSPRLIAHDLVIVHLMEGGYEGSVAWLALIRAQAAAHLCMNADGSEVTQMVPLSLEAWAECNLNGRGVSIEAPGFTAQGVADVTLRGLAWIVAWLLQTYGIPCQHAEGGQGRGFCSHHDLGAAGGGHVDICGVDDATWRLFESYVKAAYDALGAAPLPVWALHGAPAPHTVNLPPAVTPTPSHGGAARNQPGDILSHATRSGYPLGSAADIQFLLNRAGASPMLTVDGLAGPATRGAIEDFQRVRGLAVDGDVGPLTYAALEKATA
jgi:hypothetical protein